jgi:hypothetical protein
MFKELPSAAQDYKRTDFVVESGIFRVVEVVLYAKDMSVVASKFAC